MVKLNVGDVITEKKTCNQFEVTEVNKHENKIKAKTLFQSFPINKGETCTIYLDRFNEFYTM